MADVATVVSTALVAHLSIRSARLIGSQADERVHELSDWVFAVEADGFAALAVRRDLEREGPAGSRVY